MKFGRYLQETQIPEWKKAYINYRGLKKIISAIKEQDESTQPLLPSDSTAVSLAHSPNSSAHYTPPSPTAPPPAAKTPGRNYGSIGTTPPMKPRRAPEPPPIDNLPQGYSGESWSASEGTHRDSERNGNGAVGISSGRSTKSNRASIRQRSVMVRRSDNAPPTEHEPRTLDELLENLTPMEHEFFDALDRELDKVESFYKERAKDAVDRMNVLKEQLHELAEHRKAFYKAHPAEAVKLPGALTVHALREAMGIPHMPMGNGLHPTRTRQTQAGHMHEYDPEEYRHAQRRLKKALREYYRGLELLDNYRILNLTGFRKALKKFEKVSGLRFAQQYYMDEKVESCQFSSPKLIDELRTFVEVTYAARFERGDRKLAKDKLRADATPHSHHFSTFRSGLFLGLGLPALVAGIVKSFDPAVRAQIPAWGPLLQVYSALVIPVMFVLLVGINLIAWSKARINWVFIFELDLKSGVNYKEYFELPSFLFMTLCYCFWFSFSLVGAPGISPTSWPLIWLVFALVLLLDPLPIMTAPSRLWFVKTAGKLLVSGSTRVEFADFWMGDQFCSMTYTLSNLYVLSCAYQNEWDNVYNTCNPAMTWVPAFLSALPGLARLVQCIKRWADSGLKVHLINAGKYASTSVTYAMYFYWRSRGGGHDFSLALYCLFATIGSTYTSAWDLWMDMSLLRPHADHIFLREELIYSHHSYMYYVAIPTNIIGRFIWVFYMVPGSLNPSVRGFIFAVIEALRRWQWNFYRVENEHIGNADRYRVTREIPLPYTLEEDDQKEGDVDDDNSSSRSRRWGAPLLMRSIPQSEYPDGGAHGPPSARDYERQDQDSDEEGDTRAAVRAVSSRSVV